MKTRFLPKPSVQTALTVAALLTLSACNSGNQQPDVSLPPLPEPPAPGISLVELTDNQIAIYYNRDDGNYEGWGLHLWNGEGCGNYAAPTTESEHFSNWTDPYPADGIDDTYGAYYVMSYEPDSGNCLNFILHKGDEKALGAANKRFDLSQPEQYAFSFHGNANLFYDAIAELPVTVEGAAAHWIAPNTIAWQGIATGESVELVSSAEGAITFDSATKTLTGGETIALQTAAIPDDVKALFPHLNQLPAVSFPDNVASNTAQLKALLKRQLLMVVKNADGEIKGVTRVQTGGVIDALYTAGDNDADEQTYGAIVTENGVTFRLWAPTAQQVKLHLFNSDKSPLAEPLVLTANDEGIYQYQGDSSLNGAFYRYEITAWHPQTDAIETMTVTDPWSLSLATNSLYSQVVDLHAQTTQPQGWNEQAIPAIEQPEDHIIYEVQIRDFSASDMTVASGNKGKYGAFTEQNSDGFKHLKQLGEAGLNTIHLLPAFDIATVNEDASQQVNITDTIAHLCTINSNAAVCSNDSVSQDATIQSVLHTLDPATSDAQSLVESFRQLDAYNWGYDPFHYTVPEGSYASNPDGITRIIEFRAMVQALHQAGFRVVMDVVYNHTNASGVSNKSVLDKVVPGYYHRLNPATGEVEQSTCCDNTATERVMMAKLMTDSLLVWAEHYKIDGFRFDLMGHQPKAAMLAAREAVWAIDPDNYFYGEGWNFGEVADDAQFTQATQLNMAGSSIGTFTDRLRDAVRGGGPFDGGDDLRKNQGLANGLGTIDNDQATPSSGDGSFSAEYTLSMDQTRIGLAANLAEFVIRAGDNSTKKGADVDYNGQPAGYALDPADTINYVSKHDNQTLWDNNQYKVAHHVSVADRARMQTLALAYPMLAQGIPFIHMGSELLRSKSFLRDSYDYGDWFNAVDFTKQTNNFNVGLPPEEKDGANWPVITSVLNGSDGNWQVTPEDINASHDRFLDLLRLRQSSRLFRLNDEAAVKARVDFRNTGTSQQAGLVVMTIDDGVAVDDLDPSVDGIMVVFNNHAETQNFTIANLPASTSLELHPIQREGADSQVKQTMISDHTISIPGLTAAVFVVPQGSTQGAGLPVDLSTKDLSTIPPFGSTAVYLRGSMNGWGTSLQTGFVGSGVYEIAVDLDIGDYEFKFASEDWSAVNIGAGNSAVSSESLAVDANGDNWKITIEQARTYTFRVSILTDNSIQITVL